MQATRPIDQANLLNACFHSVFAPPDHGSTLNYLHQLNYSVQHKLCELKLSVNNIFKQLKLLDINKASLDLPNKFTVHSIGAFHLLMCCLNYWKGKFILRSWVLHPLILLDSSMAFCQADQLCLN